MSSSLKPITVYVHEQGPNPYKVLLALEELSIPYEKIVIHNPKDAEFIAINPNGRLPAIVDPNSDLTLWESGAIVEYIVETYDKEGKLKGTSTKENWQIKQYAAFQMSGQGPYFGQAVWVNMFHGEDVPSAKERYEKEIVRVFSVLDSVLKDKEYLVGEKFTYADLLFLPWNLIISQILKEKIYETHIVNDKYPNFAAWQQRLQARESVKKVYGQ